jgi:hypothetical protein
MIIMRDDRQPKPVERLLDWIVAYKIFKHSEEQIRNESPTPNQSEKNHA